MNFRRVMARPCTYAPSVVWFSSLKDTPLNIKEEYNSGKYKSSVKEVTLRAWVSIFFFLKLLPLDIVGFIDLC